MCRFWVIMLSVVLLASCKSQFDLLLLSNDQDLKFEKAFEYFNNEKYLKASQLFESLSEISGGTRRDDTVKFYWGYSNYLYKDYYTAEANFKHFISMYPQSAFTVYATYLRIDCLYRATYRYELDQVPTHAAIEEIHRFLIENPSSEYVPRCNEMLQDLEARLDRKAFEAAYLYYHMEDYLAARVALKNVLKDDAENIYREDILYYTAMSSYRYASNSVQSKQRERYLAFVDDYFNFVSEFPSSPRKRGLDTFYEKAVKYIRRHND